MRKQFFLLAVFLFLSFPVQAVQPDEVLPDAALESRARAISRELRCLVCQGEDIDSSNAALAGDLRRLVRARLLAGDSDAAVLEYIRRRYGDSVLMTPPVQPNTWVLWMTPAFVLLAGFGIVVYFLRRQER